jgi:hypothetical protein
LSVFDSIPSFQALKAGITLHHQITNKIFKMKKFFFAVQVFGILAMFPLYVILEMNHGLPENKNHSGVTEKPEKAAIGASLNSDAQDENSILLNYLWVPELRLVRMK